jgi:eukaryotic-like serine/threonine-protein kinase
VTIRKLSRYELLEELGRGNMGVVYKAHDPAVDRTVAVKVVRLGFSRDDAERRVFLERFQREARIAGKLSHPNIVAVHDFESGDEPFLVMEYFPGVSLSKLLDGPPVAPSEVALIATQLASALSYAHAQGVIHRDIKPANLLYQDGLLKLVDFGIAKLEASELTATGEFIGTPSYMSPEIFSGAPVDQRSDLFSLGVVVYQLLTGRKPFEGGSVSRTIYRVLHEEPSPPSSVRADISKDWDVIVENLLAKAPDERYTSADELLREVHLVGTGRLVSRAAVQDPTTPISPPWTRRKKRLAVAGALVSALLATFALLFVVVPGLVRSPPAASASASVAPSIGGSGNSPGSTAAEVAPLPPTGSIGASASAVPADVPHLEHPLRFVARHEHRIGHCTGDLVLGEREIVFETSRHGTWRWRASEIEELTRRSETEIELRARSPERGREDDTELETFRFTFLRPGVSEAELRRYLEVVKTRRGETE